METCWLTVVVCVLVTVTVVKGAPGISVVEKTDDSSFTREGRALSHSDDGIFGQVRPYYMAHACERNVLELSCPVGRVINIVRVTYGRLSMSICVEGDVSTSGWNLPCATSPRRAHRMVANNCDGQNTCLVPAVNTMFGDPCPNTYKYLEVYYACVKRNPNNMLAVSA